MKKFLYQPGSIVLYALMMLTAMLFLMQGIIKGVFLNNQFTKVMIALEQAELLAYCGIQMAVSQLMVAEAEAEQKEQAPPAALDDKQKKDTGKAQKAMLKRVLPHLIRWQNSSVVPHFRRLFPPFT